jgi:hypothetical protein
MVSAALTIKHEPGADPVNLPILLATKLLRLQN